MIQQKKKILTISDLHGKIAVFKRGVQKFRDENYDILVQMGDLADSWTATNEEIIECYKLSADLKEEFGDRFIQLQGNHENSYIYDDQLASGFRAPLKPILQPWINANKGWFQVAYHIDNTLFTHAGVQKRWYDIYKEVIHSHTGITEFTLGAALNNMLYSEVGRSALFEVGVERGGVSGNYGGPLWCDKSEILSYGPIKQLHQIVGHSEVDFIQRVEKFNGSHYNNTSVTFTDCFSKKPDTFLSLEI